MRTSRSSLLGPALLVSASVVAGCGLSSAPPDAEPAGPRAAPGAPQGDGKIAIAWTVAGQPATASTCAGIDHLVLDLDYGDRGSVEISPIPCTAGKLRYDELPEGAAAIDLVGVDAGGCTVVRGDAAGTVAAQLPSVPAPAIDLARVAGGCR